MLHIIFLILKISGILILAAVSAVLVLAGILIFTPVKYSVSASFDGSPDSVSGHARFRWLFSLISGEIHYENGKVKFDFRAAWKHFREDDFSEEKKEIPRSAPSSRPSSERSEKKEAERPKKDMQKEKMHSRTADPPDGKKEKAEANIQMPDSPSESRRESRNPHPESIRVRRILLYRDKIKYTFRRICDTIKALSRKKDKITRFLTNEIHKKAFSRLIRELKRLLRLLRPKKMEGSIKFGFQDPSHTGYALAGLSMIYPFIGEYTSIEADFEHKIFRGSAAAEGKVRALYILIPAWNLFFDKNVRITFRHIRKFRL